MRVVSCVLFEDDIPEGIPEYQKEEIRRKLRKLPEASLIFQARRGGRVASRYANRHFPKHAAILTTQFDVLAAIGDTRGQHARTLADKLGLAAATLSRSLGILERRGLVLRVTDANDRRRKLLRLTDAGKEHCRRGEDILRDVIHARVLHPLGKDLFKSVRSASEKMATVFRRQTVSEKRAEAGNPDEFWKAERRWAGASEDDIWKEGLERRTQQWRARQRDRNDPGPE